MSLKKIVVEILAWLAYIFYSLLSWTVRATVLPPERDPRQKKTKANAIYVFWHAKSFLLLSKCHSLSTAILTLDNFPNLIYARLCRHFGYRVITVSRGSFAVMELQNQLEKGYDIALALDGPAGPAGTLKPGAAALATVTGRPILAVDMDLSCSFRLNFRWDRFEIPLPFSSVTARVSEPIDVNEQNRKEAEEKIRQHLKHL